MLIKDMINMDVKEAGKILDDAKTQAKNLAAKAEKSKKRAHKKCKFYLEANEEHCEMCDALSALYCKVGICTFEQPKEKAKTA